MKRFFASFSFVLLACACSGGPDGDPDGGMPRVDAATDAAPPIDAPVTPDAGTPGDLARDYCEPLAAVVCGSAADCGCGAIVPGGTLDEAACAAQWTRECLAAWQPFVTAGARIDAAAATACVATIAARTPACARPEGSVAFAVCAPFAIDPAALGETCATPYCAGGTGVCREGSCAPRGAEGATCGDMFGCATGLACNGGTCTAFLEADEACVMDLDCAPPLRCLGGSCRALGASGAACAVTTECAIGLVCIEDACAAPASPTCSATDQCGNRALCGGARTCEPCGVADTACDDDRDCVASLYCADDTRVCTARPAEGAACARGTLCAIGLGCDTDGGTCRVLPGAGEPCAFGEMGPSLCAGELGCNDGTCGALPVEGQPCAGGNRCAAGLGCDFTPEGSICIVPRELGGACESDRSCAAAFHCGPDGTCAADLAAGAPCTASSQCPGICGPDAAGSLVCRAAPGAGDPCIESADCPDTLACTALTPTCLPEICAEI